MKKKILAGVLAGLLLLSMAACAPQTPPAEEEETPGADQPAEEPILSEEGDPADAATVREKLLGDWSYTVGAVRTDLVFTETAFEVTTTVSGVSSHSGGTYEIGEGEILLRYDHGGEKTISYLYKDGELSLGQIQ